MPALSDHWQKKMKTVFKRLNLSRDGALSRKDAELMAEQFVNYGSLERYEAEPFQHKMVEFFDLVTGNTKRDSKHKVKEADFIKVCEQLVGDGKKKQAFLDLSEPILVILFKCLNIDGDGLISRSDFNTFMRLQFGKANPGEDDMFSAMDTNQDGFIDYKEYKQSYVGFWTDTNEGASSLHYGPLVK